jgi:hypothetical protein
MLRVAAVLPIFLALLALGFLKALGVGLYVPATPLLGHGLSILLLTVSMGSLACA